MNDPYKGLTKLEKQRKLKKDVGIQNEKVEAMGQENEHAGAHWVKEEGKQDRALEKKHQDEVTEQLWDTKDQVITYKGKLLEEMRREMTFWTDELPTGFGWFCSGTNKGIVLWFHDRDKQWYAKGVKLANDPKYDLQAIARLIIRAVDDAQKLSPIIEPKIVTP